MAGMMMRVGASRIVIRMLNRYLCHRADGLARCGTDGSDFDCPVFSPDLLDAQAPPEAGEALSFLLLQYFGALTVLVFGGRGLQTHRMRRRDVITLIAGTAAGCLAIRVFTLVAK